MLDYSIILPAHNEAENLPRLLDELRAVLNSLPGNGEILVVDDGSTDPTAAVVTHAIQCDPRIRLLQLDRNQGQSQALAAGFEHALGETFITLDADGQNPPSDIPHLLTALADCDFVCGWREGRKDSWGKHLASKFANTFRRWVLQDGIHDSGCCFRAFKREAVARVKLFHGMHRFLPALVQMEGYRVREVRVSHRPRTAGRSHYGIWNRLLGPFIDLLAVTWMQRRTRAWRATELITDTPTPATTRAEITTTPQTETPVSV